MHITPPPKKKSCIYINTYIHIKVSLVSVGLNFFGEWYSGGRTLRISILADHLTAIDHIIVTQLNLPEKIMQTTRLQFDVKCRTGNPNANPLKLVVVGTFKRLKSSRQLHRTHHSFRHKKGIQLTGMFTHLQNPRRCLSTGCAQSWTHKQNQRDYNLSCPWHDYTHLLLVLGMLSLCRTIQFGCIICSSSWEPRIIKHLWTSKASCTQVIRLPYAPVTWVCSIFCSTHRCSPCLVRMLFSTQLHHMDVPIYIHMIIYMFCIHYTSITCSNKRTNLVHPTIKQKNN